MVKRRRGSLDFDNSLQPSIFDPDDVKREFARRVQQRMVDLGMNQSDLARRVTALLPASYRAGDKKSNHFGRDRISQYVRGLRLPRVEVRPLLARALDCQVQDLFPVKAIPSARSADFQTPHFLMRVNGTSAYLELRQEMPLDKAHRILSILGEGRAH